MKMNVATQSGKKAEHLLLVAVMQNRFVDYFLDIGSYIILDELCIAAIRIYSVGKENIDQIMIRIHPGGCTGKSGMPESIGRTQIGSRTATVRLRLIPTKASSVFAIVLLGKIRNRLRQKISLSSVIAILEIHLK